MSSVKILPEGGVKPPAYGSLEKGQSSASNSASSLGDQDAAAHSNLGEQNIAAVSFHDIYYTVVSLCTRKQKEILHGVR